MTEAKHTPGPWKVSTSIEGDFLGIYPDTGKSEFPVAKLPDYVRAEINNANANLIAATPDMLAVAKLPLVHQIEGSEGLIRLSIAGVEVCAHPDGTPQATALLQFDAQQRAALSKAGLPQ